jgi:hypothetical protein
MFQSLQIIFGRRFAMKPEYPCPTGPSGTKDKNEAAAPTSRLLDEKISDDSGFEGFADKALAPAELKNPFWN